MLTLIHKKIIPAIEGNNKITVNGEYLYLCNILNIILEIPNEKRIEKK